MNPPTLMELRTQPVPYTYPQASRMTAMVSMGSRARGNIFGMRHILTCENFHSVHETSRQNYIVDAIMQV